MTDAVIMAMVAARAATALRVRRMLDKAPPSNEDEIIELKGRAFDLERYNYLKEKK